MRAIILATVAALFCLPAAGAYSQSAALQPGTRTISVSGHGDAKAKPDEVIVSFALDSKAPTADTCTKLQTDKTNKIIDALKAKLGGKGEVNTANFSLTPMTESVPANTANPTPTPPGGPWNFTDQIQVYAVQIEDLGALIETGMATGAARVAQSGFEWVPIHQPSQPTNTDPGFRGRSRFEYYPEGRVQTRQEPSVTFEVQVQKATPDEAVRGGAEITHRVEQALKDKLGGKGGVQITQFTVTQVNPENRPYYMNQQFPPPSRYVVRQSFNARVNIDVKAKDLELLGPLIETGMTAGASQLNSVSFTLASDSAARKQAMAVASNEAQTKAAVVANSMGVKLGQVLSISVNAQVQPQVVYGNGFFGASSASFRSAPMNETMMRVIPHEIGFIADVNVVYQIK
ncbi:MAG: SIMPL domain-containing protein [Candidatus Binataceae bacterium]|nr:SIMPL domain-containing protein [Candidatus Binataceae bacterium]